VTVVSRTGFSSRPEGARPEAVRPGAAPLTDLSSGPREPAAASIPARPRPVEVLRALSRIRRTAALYGREHPVIQRFVTDAFDALSRMLAERPTLAIFVHEDTFFVDDTILLEDSLQLSSLLAEFKRREILCLEVHRGLQVYELRAFVEMLNRRAADVQQAGGTTAYLTERGVSHIVASSTQANPITSRGGTIRVEPGDAYRAGLRVMDDLYAQASADGTFNLRRARVVVDSLVDVLTKDRAGLMQAALIKNYDANTAHHSVNVAILSLFMASRLHFDAELTTTLGLAALLHDVGKVRVPLEILNKTSTLTDEERVIMQQHPVTGAHMLRSLSGLSRLAMVVAFEHHANFDLSGYPRLTTKPRQHQLSRLVQIADVFDAATSARRVYRRPQAPYEAMRFIVEGAGRLYDPALVRVFVQEMGIYPVGTLVGLDGGEFGVVRRPGRLDPTRPYVGVIDSKVSLPRVSRELNLEKDQSRRIVGSVDLADVGIDRAVIEALVDDAATGSTSQDS
jgi:putative nucleotidyltransferase with HDIG domain